MSKPIAVVMAAGQGTRMKSELPKVLFPVCGRPMIEYVLDALAAAGVERTCVIVGYRADDVKQALAGRRGLEFALQAEQRGTGHAVMCAAANLELHAGAVIVLAGDSPMVQSDSLRGLLGEYEQSKPACILGTGNKDNPQGLGRIVRDPQGNFARIVEEKDASQAEREIHEVNLSCYVFDTPQLLWALGQIQTNNAQGEYYLTDCPAVLLQAGRDVRALNILKPIEALSINNREQLAEVEAVMRQLGMARDA